MQRHSVLFYVPKAVLVLTIWVLIMSRALYVHFGEILDPTLDPQYDRDPYFTVRPTGPDLSDGVSGQERLFKLLGYAKLHGINL